MDKLIIHGGRPLKGVVRVSGAKNSALPIMSATLLAPGQHILHNIPRVADVRTMGRLLAHMGGQIEAGSRKQEAGNDEIMLHASCFMPHASCFKVDTSNITAPEAPHDIVKTMRASSLVLGPLVARFGRARVSLPGGCAIGARPLNLHIEALKAMGAEITLDAGYVDAHARRLKGVPIHFDTVTVTGTENIMMAAVLADGVTTIENAACEPEVADLAGYLIKMGAKISGAGTSKIVVEGVNSLTPAEHTIIPDRIEAGTFASAAAITGGEITIENCPPAFLEAALVKLQAAGCRLQASGIRHQATSAEGLRPVACGLWHSGFQIQAPPKLKATDVATAPFPGFPTDLQAQFMACMAIAEGTSIIEERIFENRFMHVCELMRLGADISIEGGTAIVNPVRGAGLSNGVRGVKKLIGAPVTATDLRASASLVLAGLAAEGTTTVHRIYHLDRGYEGLEIKLKELGADIEREVDE